MQSNKGRELLIVGVIGAFAFALFGTLGVLGIYLLVLLAGGIGYAVGREDGKARGYNDGKSENMSLSFARGVEQGRKEGYQQGFDAGQEDSLEVNIVQVLPPPVFITVVNIVQVSITRITNIIFGNKEAERDAFARGYLAALDLDSRIPAQDAPSAPTTPEAEQKYPNTVFGSLSKGGMYYPPAVTLSERAGDGDDEAAAKLFGGDLEADGCDNPACSCNGATEGGYGKGGF